MIEPCLAGHLPEAAYGVRKSVRDLQPQEEQLG